MREALLKTEDGFNFLLSKAAREFDLSVPDQKRKGLDMVMAVTAKMSDPVIREDYVQRIAAFFKTSAELLKLELQPGQATERSEQAAENKPDGRKDPGSAPARPGGDPGDPGILQRRTPGHAGQPEHPAPVVRQL